MILSKKSTVYHLLLPVLLLLFVSSSMLMAGNAKNELVINDWLILGPNNLYPPVFVNLREKEIITEVSKINPFKVIDLIPAEGDAVKWPFPYSDTSTWKKSGDAKISFGKFSSENYQIAYAITYLNVSDYIKADLKINSTSSVKVYYDGKEILKLANSEQDKNKDSNASIDLEPGFHSLVFKSIANKKSGKDKWTLSAALKADKAFNINDFVAYSSSRNHYLDYKELLSSPTIRSVDISPDGKLAIIWCAQEDWPDFNRSSCVSVVDIATGKLIHKFIGDRIPSRFEWSPDSSMISFLISKNGISNFNLLKLSDLSVKEISADIKNLTYYRWAPSGEFIVVAYNTESEPAKEGVNRIRSINDRDPYTRSKTHISMLDITSGALLPIAKGLDDTQLLDISADGEKLLLAQETEDYTERLFSIHKYYILNLKTSAMELVISDRFARDANFSPDGGSILVQGGPSFADSAGKVIDKDKIPNDYDAQAYIVDLKSKDVKPISRDFDPAISRPFWSRKDGNIYFLAGIGQYVKVYKYEVASGKYSQIEIPIDVIRDFDIADDAETGICFGTNADYPNRIFTFNITDLSSKLFMDPMKNIMNNIKIGKVEDWNFTNKTGYTIEGRIHFPPNFDKNKKWPLIVNFYGGTSPVEKTFGGRYPANWYAANGYVIYILQPRGCTGYGQEFSSYHVNDWGKYALEDIIEGTEKFIAAHDYIDGKKVGCIGASYGGFTVELLVTKTNIFSAAISHAGISQLASYWGGGYWGVTYSAVATANKYPWNARDIYVDRSALYNADKIHTPLLLLHGDSDTNVPTHESDYLYSALKILGRDVELIKVIGEDHWVMNSKNRIIWYKTIMAWFNRYLKDEPDYWQFLYPPITEE